MCTAVQGARLLSTKASEHQEADPSPPEVNTELDFLLNYLDVFANIAVLSPLVNMGHGIYANDVKLLFKSPSG